MTKLSRMILALLSALLLSQVTSGREFNIHTSDLTEEDRMYIIVDLIEEAINSPDPYAARRLSEVIDSTTTEQLKEQLSMGSRVVLTPVSYESEARAHTVKVLVQNRGILQLQDTVTLNFTGTARSLRLQDFDQSVSELRGFIQNVKRSSLSLSLNESPEDSGDINISDYTSPNLFKTIWLDPGLSVHQFTTTTSNSLFGVKILERPEAICAFSYISPGMDPSFSYVFLMRADPLTGEGRCIRTISRAVQ